MKFLEKLLDEIKNIMYDFIIYIIPGFIGLILIGITIFIIGEKNILVDVINNNEFNWIFSKFNNSIILYLTLIVVSYIFGHIISFYSDFLAHILLPNRKNDKSQIKTKNIFLKKQKEINGKYKYLNIIQRGLIDKFKEDTVLNISELENKDIERMISTFGSTNSRFEGHNDLIQKYIVKENMYKSLCLLALIGMIDLIVYVILNLHELFLFPNDINASIKNGVIIFILGASIFGAFKGFFNESIRHGCLRKKEVYLYLYNKFVNYKNPEEIN